MNKPKRELFERAIQIYEAQLEDAKMSIVLSNSCLKMLKRELAKLPAVKVAGVA